MLYSAVSFNRKFHTEMYHFAQLKLFVSLRQVALALTYQSLFVVFEWWEERSARSCEITRGKKRGNRFEAISWIILYFLLNFTQAYSLLRGHSTAYNLSLERFTHRFDLFSYPQKKERKKICSRKIIEKSSQPMQCGQPDGHVFDPYSRERLISHHLWMAHLIATCQSALPFDCLFITCSASPLVSLHFIQRSTKKIKIYHEKSTSIDSDSEILGVHWDEEISYWFPFHLTRFLYAREWRFHQNMKGTNHSRIRCVAAASFTSNLHSPVSFPPTLCPRSL